MKKRSFLFGALAALAMVGCSDNEIEKDNGFVVPEDGVVYAKISVAMAGNGMGSRGFATGNEEFDPGTNGKDDVIGENDINSLLFVFYNKNGIVVGNSLVDKEKLDAMTLMNKKDELGATHMFQGVVQVTLNPAITETPSYVMAYANPQNTGDQRNPLPQVLHQERGNVKDSDGYFTMNNSVYYDESGKLVTATPTKPEEYFDSEDDARQSTSKTTIYLERMAAKVTANISSTLKNDPYEVNESKHLVFDIAHAKWCLTGTEKKMFLIKNLPETKSAAEEFVGNWAFSSYRTYWARSYTYTAEGKGNAVFGGNADPTFPTTGLGAENVEYSLEYSLYSDVKNSFGETPEYCLENTGRPAKYNDYPSASTNILIAGKYKVQDANGNLVAGFNGEGDAAPTFYYFTNDLYLDDVNQGANGSLRTAMVKNQVSVYADAKGTTPAGEDNFQVIQIEGQPASRYYLQLKDGISNLYYKVGDNCTLIGADEGQTSVSAVNNALQEMVPSAIKYNHGEAFFSVPIEHTGIRDNDGALLTGTYGVVRNHSYKITINSIQGLANGVDDDEPLIPTPRDQTKYWVGADIKTLSWHVVTQGVDLK